MLSPWGRKELDKTERVSISASVMSRLITDGSSHSGLGVSACSLLHLPSIHLFCCAGSWLQQAGSSIFLVARRIFNYGVRPLSCGTCDLVS